MRRLYGEVGERLAPLGYVPEERPYAAHLTIARIRDPVPGSSRSVREILTALPADCGTSRVAAVTLFRSHLSPKGAAYEPLLRVPLS
jgi:2'-5' RNA ligase